MQLNSNCKYFQNIYKMLQEKYKNINRKRIYNEKVYDIYRIALDGHDKKSLSKISDF